MCLRIWAQSHHEQEFAMRAEASSLMKCTICAHLIHSIHPPNSELRKYMLYDEVETAGEAPLKMALR